MVWAVCSNTMKYPSSLEKLIKCFEMYPGIGPKTAERLAFFTISKVSLDNAKKFSEAIVEAMTNIKACRICSSLTELDVCDICLDEERIPEIMIVENSKDVISFEKMGGYRGKYHVLNGVISPLNGVGPDQINLDSLFSRIEKEHIKKIVIALSSTIAGEITSAYIKNMLRETDVSVYRIGYGLPVGADIEYADEITLKKALEGIKEI